MVRCLHQHALGVTAEPTHAGLQKRAGGYVVAIEDRDVLAMRVLQGVVDVARFGV